MSQKRNASLFAASVAALAMSSVATATQTIHYDQDFTAGSISGGVGSITFADGGWALQSQEAWRNASQTYYGIPKARAFNPPAGYGAGGAPPAGNAGFGFGGFATLGLANTPVLQTGNVWVLDVSMISDLGASEDFGGTFLNGAPGVAIESADFGQAFVSATKATPDQTSVFSAYYNNGADASTEPRLVPNTHSAALSTALNDTLRAKFVYQPNGTGGAQTTRLSTQALAPNGTSLGTGAHSDGDLPFKTNYSSGLWLQMMSNHGTGTVTYASGVTGLTGGSASKIGVTYANAENADNLELGVTHVTFKQVRQSDFNTDGVVNVSGDGSKLVANLGGSGKSFFDGDTNGDGLVNVSADGSKFVSQLGTDVLGSGAGLAEYDFNTGIVRISTNGAGFIEISKTGSPLLIPGNAVPTNTPGLNAAFSDPFTTTTVNYLNFSPLGTGGILDDFSIGAILPAGISDPSGFVPGALFRWSVVGGGEFSAGVHIVPEPVSGLVFAGMAGLAFARRRRN